VTATPRTTDVAEIADAEWQVDSIPVRGTLVRPLGGGPFPAVVFVAGSGPTDRDWHTPLLPGNNGSARLLADQLSRAGFASLRYDKRASGPHARENVARMIGKVSMQGHVDELAGAVRALAKQSFVRTKSIFGVANSEGTLHALNYQLHAPEIPFAGLVLIAPPGRSVGAVARSQIAAQVTTLPNGDGMMALYDSAIARFLAGEPFAPDPSLPEGIRALLSGLAAPANLPFARELWMADSAPLVARIDVPTLVIIGKKDIQVDWRADGAPLQHAAAENKYVSFLFPEDANHVLKHEPRPRSALNAADALTSYNGPDAKLDADAMASIMEWLTAAAGSPHHVA
jgi:pimeloyl-ACP methyl ester carboxylesterase